MRERYSILLAEDDETDALLLQRAFKDADVHNPLHVTKDGAEAVEFLSRARDSDGAPMPALVILDIKMPRLNGVEALEWIRQQPVMRRLPVFMFSSSSRAEDIEDAYERGANGYFVKPPSIVERTQLARLLKDWLELNEPPLASRESFRDASAFRSRRSAEPRR